MSRTKADQSRLQRDCAAKKRNFIFARAAANDGRPRTEAGQFGRATEAVLLQEAGRGNRSYISTEEALLREALRARAEAEGKRR